MREKRRIASFNYHKNRLPDPLTCDFFYSHSSTSDCTTAKCFLNIGLIIFSNKLKMFLKIPSFSSVPNSLNMTHNTVWNAELDTLIWSQYKISSHRNTNYVQLIQSLIWYSLYYYADTFHFYCIDILVNISLNLLCHSSHRKVFLLSLIYLYKLFNVTSGCWIFHLSPHQFSAENFNTTSIDSNRSKDFHLTEAKITNTAVHSAFLLQSNRMAEAGRDFWAYLVQHLLKQGHQEEGALHHAWVTFLRSPRRLSGFFGQLMPVLHYSHG